MSDRPQHWQIAANRALTLDHPRIIGILNVTPDSFSDGGQYGSVDDAVAAAMQLQHEGACMIDVGGESTRPGAHSVAASEQIRRTAPVIEQLRARVSRDDLLISIDTTRSEVAHAALDAGADVINDISAGMDDDAMLHLAASRGCGLILMHRRTRPQHDSFSHQYLAAPDYGGDVVSAVCRFLQERIDAAMTAGMCREALVIDPGLGFGKSVEQNYELIRGTRELLSLGVPILCAASRKSFIGAITGQAIASQRIIGSVTISIAQYLQGARLFRVHDVAAHRQALAVAHRCANTSSIA